MNFPKIYLGTIWYFGKIKKFKEADPRWPLLRTGRNSYDK